MKYLHIDIETFSSVDLVKCGVYRYAESPDFEILMASWSYDGSSVALAIGREEIEAIPGLRDPKIMKVAHNAQFERICFSSFFGLPVGEYLSPDEWEDTAALAAEAGLPRGLGALAKALGVQDKDPVGPALIRWFCMPTKTGERRLPQDHPEKWAQFCEYGIQDTRTLVDVHWALPDWPPGERAVFLADQRVNDRGIAVDREMAAIAVALDEGNRDRVGEQLRAVLGVENAGSVVQLVRALAADGLEIDNLRAATVEELLAGDTLSSKQRTALELRQSMALVAALKYRAALAACSSDGRLRGQFKFYGAHTGRWSSRGVQIQNLPRIKMDQIEEHILDLKLGFDPGPKILKSLIRSVFVGPFTVVDYSAIEARGLAWLAEEAWVLGAFRAGRDIYTETAKRMSTADRPLSRQQGKVAVLALGYAGGVNSLRGMGAEGTDAELQSLVSRYREANPKICRSWRTMERVFVDGGSVGRLEVQRDGDTRRLFLPSGRPLVYHGVRTEDGPKGRRITFDDPKGYRSDTYGGRLIENATQAVCRDVLAQAMLNLEEAGFETVGHVHDEVLVEGTHPVAEIAELICRLPSWASGFPIDAEGFRCNRYQKDPN